MAKYILFDTETTGAGDKDRIIQIGGMVVHGREEIDVYDELCRADVPIAIEAMEVHQITPDVIENKPAYAELPFSKVLEQYNHESNYLIAHNISFDLGMLEKEGFKSNYQHIDTLRCAKHLLPNSPYHRLQYLRYSLELYKIEGAEADNLDITIKAHDAIGDVLIMKLLLSKLVILAKQKFVQEPNPMITLATLTKTPVLVHTFKFGKYKGREVSQVAKEDERYLKWMQSNMDLDEDLSYTLTHYLG